MIYFDPVLLKNLDKDNYIKFLLYHNVASLTTLYLAVFAAGCVFPFDLVLSSTEEKCSNYINYIRFQILVQFLCQKIYSGHKMSPRAFLPALCLDLNCIPKKIESQVMAFFYVLDCLGRSW